MDTNVLYAAILKSFDSMNAAISEQVSRSFQAFDVRSCAQILSNTIADAYQSAIRYQDVALANRLRLVQNRAEDLCTVVAKNGAETSELSPDVCARAEKLAEKANGFLPNQNAVQVPKRMTFAEFWQMVGVLIAMLTLVYQAASDMAERKQRSVPLPEQHVVDRIDLGADFPQHDGDVNQCAMLVLDAVEDCFQQLAHDVPVTRDEHLGQCDKDL